MARQKLRTKERTKIRLRKNDVVEVISGRDAGKRGKVISVLEGGYNANALAECIEYHLAVLANDGFV